MGEIGMNTHNSRKLHSLVIFRNLLKDETITKLIALFDCDETNKNELTDKYCDFAESLLYHGGNLSQYVLKLILEDENLYTTYKITGRGDGELLEPLLERELKVLEYLSRGAYKTAPFRTDKANQRLWDFMRSGINSYLGTSFTHADMDEIYTYLGNGVNRPKTIRFIESGYDMRILSEGGTK